jgi:methylase of polypeptide subunit release factors
VRKVLRLSPLLYKLYGSFVFRLRSSPTSVRLLFGFNPDAVLPLHGGYWDWTTLALRQALLRYAPSGKTLLDMGTGPVGILAMFSALKLNTKQVCAADLLPENILTARSLARKCGLQIDFVESDLFRNIDGVYDVIVFNPPYVDTETGKRLGIYPTIQNEARSNGGRFGLEIVTRFVREAPGHLATGGSILLGLSNFHLPAQRVEQLFADTPFQVLTESNWVPGPSRVCLLRAKTNSPNGDK